jgi:RNA polymerase sigma-70 factor (ECF subfamily)
VFVLREAFDYPYRQVADVLGLSEANARQLLVRARARLASGRRPAASGDHRRLLAAFTAAADTGDLAPLEHLLAAPA